MYINDDNVAALLFHSLTTCIGYLKMVFASFLTTLLGVGLVAAQQSCPGYTASNIQQSGVGLTADLQLAGPACNIYGLDLPQLTLTVEYQSG